jgi:hypothetical protein
MRRLAEGVAMAGLARKLAILTLVKIAALAAIYQYAFAHVPTAPLDAAQHIAGPARPS